MSDVGTHALRLSHRRSINHSIRISHLQQFTYPSDYLHVIRSAILLALMLPSGPL